MPDIDGRVILLILFVVISAVKWLIEKIQTKDQAAEQEEPPDNLETLYDEYRDEIRQRQTELQRRQAAQTPPPIPVQTPAQAPARAPARPPASPPVAAPAPPAYAQRQSTPISAPVSTPASKAQPAPSFKPRKTTVSAEQQAAASRFEQLSSGKSKPSPQSYVRALLSNPQSTRQAIILTEILGKPKSLQSR
jgi:hypothetical protein